MAKPLPMVIYAYGGGRFGNQFLRFAHWLAWVLDCHNNVRVVDLPFWPYASLFATWSEYPGCVYPLQRSWIDRIAGCRQWLHPRVIRHGEWRMQRVFACGARCLPGVRTLVLDDAAGEERTLSPETFRDGSGPIVCAGWRFSAWAALERHEEPVRALLQPAIRPAGISETFVAELRKRYDVLVGLFVRRGDYREWAGGQYYYPWESYIRWSSELPALFPGRRVGIVLTGDEMLPLPLWTELPAVPATGSVNRKGHWFESFLELAACDYVVSPPSTFSACAAFLGNRPLWPLLCPDQKLSIDQIMPRHVFAARSDSIFSLAVK